MIQPLREALKYTLIVLLIIIGAIALLILGMCPEYTLYALNQLNNFGLLSLIGILAAVFVALFIFNSQKKESYKNDIKYQITILKSLMAELDVLHSSITTIFLTDMKGNMDWYKEELDKIHDAKSAKQYTGKLDHPINKIHFQVYLTKVDEEICKNMNVRELIRGLSWINDKVYEINSQTKNLKNKFEIKDKKSLVTEFIEPTKRIIRLIKNALLIQINLLKKESRK